ncbi:hypothetical protein TRVL_08581 [Trypanosoma vivax]|nr:hypothetical protein TRVL_08581 [Trypanosoma vivax]
MCGLRNLSTYRKGQQSGSNPQRWSITISTRGRVAVDIRVRAVRSSFAAHVFVSLDAPRGGSWVFSPLRRLSPIELRYAFSPRTAGKTVTPSRTTDGHRCSVSFVRGNRN